MPSPTGKNACFQEIDISGRYRPADHPRDTFLIPLLEGAVAYDRAAGYFSSSSLAAAAEGLEPFAMGGGRIRLVVNHQLSDDDVAAVERGLGLRETVRSALEKVALSATGGDGAEPARLRLLSTLVALGQLDLKVAVAADDDGNPLPRELVDRIHHAKFGTFKDRCDPPCIVAFEGSNNESRSGWLENYETYSAFVSWKSESWVEHGVPIMEDFQAHWNPQTAPPGWAIVELPDAARDGLIAGADPDLARKALIEQGREEEIDAVVGRILEARGEKPTETPLGDLDELLAAPRLRAGVGIGTSTVEMWPHQFDVARKVVSAWPCSRMFSDEVGLGKTIEVGAVVRELLVSGAVQRALLLVPASVIWQWQSELWEKFSLAVPVLDGRKLAWRDVPHPGGTAAGDHVEPVPGNRWDAADVMLASSHLARRGSERQHLVDRSWDLVVVDEAHHARRRGSKATKDDPNALLQLLRRMRDAESWKGVLLATATPMQMNPHEAYDLLAVLGLPGPHPEHPDDVAWSNGGAVGFNRYYEQLVVEDPDGRDWRHLRSYARSHAAAFPGHNPHLEDAIREQASEGTIGRSAAKKIVKFAEAINEKPYRRMKSNELPWLDAWLREHTPMRALVHRNTRHLLRAYKDSGILGEDVVIPRRQVRDLYVEFDEGQDGVTAEQELYDRIETWIRDKYAQVTEAAAKGDKKARATGFIMTVYRRRLTSSFKAIELSLRKRRNLLAEKTDGLFNLAALLEDDDRTALEDVPDELIGLLDVEDGDDPSLNVAQAAGATASEIEELDAFLQALENRPAYDSKLQKLVDDLRTQIGHTKPDGGPRQAIVFTQFTDTMDALREQLAGIWPGKVGCYSGRGGEVHDPVTGRWGKVDKSAIKASFREGEYRILVGTDAMSEGLNLQTCDLLYNLDLPWNFMRIEQRIGRIDRIGGHPVVHIVNLLVRGTVEERIYSGIKGDFADFEQVVGAAQPVLAQTEEAIREAALASGPDRDELLKHQAQALIDAAAEATTAAVNLDTFQHDDNTWRPAQPLEGETDGGAQWFDRLREALTSHPVMGQRFETEGGDVWSYEDGFGRRWQVTFDPKVADASGGRVGLFVWGHPAFPRGTS